MNTAARGRALAARQIDQSQFAATAWWDLVPPRRGGGDAVRFLRNGDRQQSVAAAAATILQRRRCLPGLCTLLHVGHQRPQADNRVVGQTCCKESSKICEFERETSKLRQVTENFIILIGEWNYIA